MGESLFRAESKPRIDRKASKEEDQTFFVVLPVLRIKMGKDDQGESGSVEVMMPDGFGSSFSTKEIRAKFVRKAYATLLSQLTITIVIMMIFLFTPAIRGFYCNGVVYDENGIGHCERGPSSNGFIVYIVSYVIFFVTYLAIACCESVRRKSPGNMIAMGIFTLALSIMTASIAIHHDVYWVIMAIGITAALCLGLTLFSFQTKIDFTGIGMYLFACTWILFIFGILAIVFFARNYPVIHTVYSALIALLFSVYLVYDTQQIMGGKKYEISPEEHIYASVQLYIDVVYIFLAILSLGRK